MLTPATKVLGTALAALLSGQAVPPASPIPVPRAVASVRRGVEAPSGEALRARVVAALEASPEVDADQVAVSVEGRTVTLEGEVATRREAEVAVLLAYEAGAQEVRADFEGFDGGGASD